MNGDTIASSFGSVAMGQYNVGAHASGGDTTWITTDPLLEVGNGTDIPINPTPSSSIKRRHRRTGNLSVGGVITCTAGGDIPMYTGHYPRNRTISLVAAVYDRRLR